MKMLMTFITLTSFLGQSLWARTPSKDLQHFAATLQTELFVKGKMSSPEQTQEAINIFAQKITDYALQSNMTPQQEWSELASMVKSPEQQQALKSALESLELRGRSSSPQEFAALVVNALNQSSPQGFGWSFREHREKLRIYANNLALLAAIGFMYALTQSPGEKPNICNPYTEADRCGLTKDEYDKEWADYNGEVVNSKKEKHRYAIASGVVAAISAVLYAVPPLPEKRDK